MPYASPYDRLLPCVSAAAQKFPVLSPYVLSGLPIGTGRVYSAVAVSVIRTEFIPRRPRKYVPKERDTVTSRRRLDSALIAGVTVEPPAAQ